MNESNGYLGSHKVEDKVGIQTHVCLTSKPILLSVVGIGNGALAKFSWEKTRYNRDR